MRGQCVGGVHRQLAHVVAAHIGEAVGAIGPEWAVEALPPGEHAVGEPSALYGLHEVGALAGDHDLCDTDVAHPEGSEQLAEG